MKKILYRIGNLLYILSGKIFKRIEEQEHLAWLEYQKRNKKFVCGINGTECTHKACWDKKAWEHHGCMYLKGYKNY